MKCVGGQEANQQCDADEWDCVATEVARLAGENERVCYELVYLVNERYHVVGFNASAIETEATPCVQACNSFQPNHDEVWCLHYHLVFDSNLHRIFPLRRLIRPRVEVFGNAESGLCHELVFFTDAEKIEDAHKRVLVKYEVQAEECGKE